MKIKPKIIFMETFLTLILLFSGIFTITRFQEIMKLEDYKIITINLKNSSADLGFSVAEMLYAPPSVPGSVLTAKYSSLINEVNDNLNLISDEKIITNLSMNTILLLSQLRQSQKDISGYFQKEELSGILDLREISPVKSSLAYLLIIPEYKQQLPDQLQEKIQDGYTRLQELNHNYIKYFQSDTKKLLVSINKDINTYTKKIFTTAASVPITAIIVSLAGMLIFASSFSSKLKLMDTTLIRITSGDFSTRIRIEGNDEFSTLAGNINTLTGTLNSKIESFRIVMDEIQQVLISDTETEQLDLGNVESTILKLALKDTAADGAALYRVAGEEGELMLSSIEGKFRPPYSVADLPESPDEEDIEALLRARIIQPGITVLGESAVNGTPLLIRNVEESNVEWKRHSADPLYIYAFMVLPLLSGTTVLGVIALSSSREGASFSDLEFANMLSFAALAATTLDSIYKYSDLLEASQLNRELNIADEIQKNLLPKKMPRIPYGEVAYMKRSLKGLNGDFFDVIPINNKKTMIAICEVAGKGVPAGLVMVMIRTILRLISADAEDAQSIITMLNNDMTEKIAIENYANVGIAVIEQDGSFTYSSAAHYPMQLIRAGNEHVENIQTEGIPIGVDRNTVYSQQKGKLNGEDLLILFTDGIPEARNKSGKLFGMENLIKAVKSANNNNPENITELIKAEIEFFERGTFQKDDQTTVVFKYTGGEK